MSRARQETTTGTGRGMADDRSKRQRTTTTIAAAGPAPLPMTLPSVCEMRSFGLQDKAEAVSTARATWGADMTKWREVAFEHIDTKESAQHIRAQQRAYRRQLLHPNNP
ncbi:hypothetical protein SPRG_12354 [Saprolegnia parasitica CBS 223.65]|uniref:Uncharacterized protein n=1 Tax=Saprolegnia parasitica (strain CBS 223.65) TaxID=695850 RepID=A0A067BTK7_SAPPC|nr:hypothetical protein SPRG_12354 [Saprolegnia parasitica CBS 223.65]KDO21854.1 hypothetical protein SPRG_12354 [Saprolegnia parasitica CBS 223.65]|eukprot:XP_012207411.1 hypothetical protein SPRG_12354 [Saprolegnia parasitica CBS 223.65]